MGYLNHIPVRMLTPKHLLSGPPHIDTPLHMATRAGFLKQIPKDILTSTLLLSCNHEGLTVLFIASICGHLDHIPRALLTQEALLASVGRSNCQGSSTALHAAATIGEIKKIPKELLTAELMLTPNSDGHTPIELVCLYTPSKDIRGAFPLKTLLDLQKDSRTPSSCLPWLHEEALRIQTLLNAIQQQTHHAL
jgi:ankyrin repeat protein